MTVTPLIPDFEERPVVSAPVRVFLSYARADREKADWLYDRLIDAGVAVWMDRESLAGGHQWKQEIDKHLHSQHFIVSLVTRTSLGPDREWVRYEENRGFELLKTIVPCLFEEDTSALDNPGLTEALRERHVIHFADRTSGFRELVNSLRALAIRPGPGFVNHTPSVGDTFVGRLDDLRRAKRLIDEGAVTQTGKKGIAIVGMGGLGKTMLAHELLRRLEPYHPGGVIFESRADPRPAVSVMKDWAEEMGRPLTDEYKSEKALAVDMCDRFSKFGNLVVLFDDAQAGDARELSHLLSAFPPDATRIVTTRRKDLLRSLGLVALPLKSMEPADALLLLETRLYEEFGAASQTSEQFKETLAPYNEALEVLVGKVDGHPLALDLGIGACDDLFEIPQLVDRLVKSLDTGVEHFEDPVANEAAEQNQSLARSLSISLGDLVQHDEDEGTDWASRFRALGVFPDGSTIPRALLLEVWGDDPDDPAPGDLAMKGLRRRAMLRVEEEARYSCHPVVRAYASGLLGTKPKQAAAVRRRYEHRVVERSSEVFTKGNKEHWHQHTGLVAHVQHVARQLIDDFEVSIGKLGRASAPEAPKKKHRKQLRTVDERDLKLGLALAHAVKEYVIRRPEWGERGLQCLRLGLAAARGLGDEEGIVEFLKRLGGALTRPAPKLAGQYFAAALELARETDNQPQVGEILSYYGELERTRGHTKKALKLLDGALEAHEAAGEAGLPMKAATHKYIGEVYWRMSDFDHALDHYGRAGEIYKASSDLSGEADIRNKIGSVEFNRGNHEAAIEWFDRALELHKKVNNRSMEAEDYNDKGAANRYLGNKAEALKLFEESRDIHVNLGNRRLESIARSNRSGVLSDTGQYTEALEEAATAKHIAQEVGDPVPLFWAQCWEGCALAGLARDDEAEVSFEASLATCRETTNPRGLAGVLGMYGAFLRDADRRKKRAKNLLKEAVQVMEKHNLAQAFGGRTREEMNDLLTEVSA